MKGYVAAVVPPHPSGEGWAGRSAAHWQVCAELLLVCPGWKAYPSALVWQEEGCLWLMLSARPLVALEANGADGPLPLSFCGVADAAAGLAA